MGINGVLGAGNQGTASPQPALSYAHNGLLGLPPAAADQRPWYTATGQIQRQQAMEDPESGAQPKPAGWRSYAPAALRLDVLGPPADESVKTFDERDFDTPRELAHPPLVPEGLPTSPSQRKTKSRAAHALARNSSFTSRNSLKDSKVLMVTGMKRSDSLLHPDLFRYHNHFEFLGVVGRTRLSEVFRVQHRQTGDLYAVKRSRRRFKSKLHRERCLREISAVAALPSHQNIVGQYRAWQEGGHFYIQMDLCEGGNLHQLVAAAASEGSLLSNEELWTVMWEVASGLEFLHSHGVLHLDIKPENIYRNRDGVCQIGDFGLAVSVGTKEWWEEGDGDYVAPELLREGGCPSPAADVYSLGATLYECATGTRLAQQVHQGARPEAATLPGRPSALQALMQWMLQPDPSERPSASQVLQYIQEQGVALLSPGDCASAPGGSTPTAARTEAVAASPSAVATLLGAAAAAAMAGLPKSPFAGCPMEEGGGCTSHPGMDEDGGFTSPPGMDEDGGFTSPPAPISPDEPCVEIPAPATAVADAQPFSFARLPPVSVRKPPHGRAVSGSRMEAGEGGSAASTPLGRPPNRGRSFSAAVARRAAAAAAAGMQRWVPSLSPLVSEGALTPGALARLSPFASGTAPRGGVESSPGSAPRSGAPSRSTTPGSAPRSTPPSVLGQQQRMQHSTDSREGWHLSRRDMISPDSDALACSVTESDMYSFSCGTGGSVSSLDFMDTGAASNPASPEFQSAAVTHAVTPELFTSKALAPSLPPEVEEEPAAAAAAEGAAEAPVVAIRPPPAGSLAWDLHTSPEFLMQLPPGSPAFSPSTMEDALPTRSFSSIRRFPTLDSMGSMQVDLPPASESKGPAEVAGSKLGSLRSFPSLPQWLSNNLGQGLPSEQQQQGGATSSEAARARKRPLSRHNSRRGLLGMLSREGSMASCGSLDQIPPPQQAQQLQPVAWAAQCGQPGGEDAMAEGQQRDENTAPCWGGGEPVVGAAAVWALKAVGSSSSLQEGAAAGPWPALAPLQQCGYPAAAAAPIQQLCPLREKITGPLLGMTLSDGSSGGVH